MIDLRTDSMALLKTLKIGDVFLDADGVERTITDLGKDEQGNVIRVEYS